MMFGGASIVPLVSELLKMYYTTLTVMCGVKYSVSLFLNGVYNIPILNHIIIPQTKLYNIFFMVYIISLIQYVIKYYINFTIVTLDYLVSMIPDWLNILWVFVDMRIPMMVCLRLSY